jgi:hypothetical protein
MDNEPLYAVAIRYQDGPFKICTLNSGSCGQWELWTKEEALKQAQREIRSGLDPKNVRIVEYKTVPFEIELKVK